MSNSRHQAGYGILIYATLVVFLLTLMPFRFSIPDNYFWLTAGPKKDIVLNVLLFIPIGFLFRLAFRYKAVPAYLSAFAYSKSGTATDCKRNLSIKIS